MNNLKRAIDTELSRLRVTERERALLLENAMEGKKVKKKLSVAFVLTMTLVLLATAALAYALLSNQYFEDVATLQFENGYYEDWSLNEKLAMLRLMKKYGVSMNDTEADVLLAGGMPDAEREARIDTLMIDKYGVDGRMDVITLESVLETEWGGDISTWTMEQKAWYSQMLIDTGLMGKDDDVYSLPTSEDVQPDAAIQIAKAEIERFWGLTDEDLASYDARFEFRAHVSEKDKTFYEIRFVPQNGDGKTYYCSVSRKGALMTSADALGASSPEEQQAWEQRDAERALHDYDREADQLMTDYANAHGLEGVNFFHFPIEDKAACAELVRPVIQANMAADPLYNDAQMIVLASRVYGVPSDGDMTQDEAIAASRALLAKELSISDEMAANFDSQTLFYDVTDASTPLWKLQFFPYGSDAYEKEHPEDYRSWLVILNARTREVVKLWNIQFEPDMTQVEEYELRM